MKEIILEKAEKAIIKYGMVASGDGIVVGLSGGPDSVCLFHVLCSLKRKLQIGDIIAVHINHGMRGAESDGDEEYARRLAESMGAEFISFKYDVPAVAAASGEGTEEAGRRLRYAAFEKIRREKGAARIAVAHNMNDQAETVMMRIMRGTGLRGLAGIDHMRADGIVIRPLLDVKRSEIEAYCEENGLAPHIDSTNKQAIYTRNKIRLNLLPEIQRDFNPNIMEALVRLSEQAREDEDFIMNAAAEFADGRWDDKSLSLSLDGFSGLHSAVAKRVIMLCAQRAGMEQNMSALHLENTLRLASAGAEAKQTDLSDGFYVRVSYGKLWFVRRRGAERSAAGQAARGCGAGEEAAAATLGGALGAAAACAALPVGELERTGCAEFEFGGHHFVCRVMPADAAGEKMGGGCAGSAAAQAARGASFSASCLSPGGVVSNAQRSVLLKFDFDSIRAKENVVIRFRMPGDRITPIGMKGSKKLQNYFVDRKIPQHLRDETVLIVSLGRVIAAGREVTAECPVNSGTMQILTIEY